MKIKLVLLAILMVGLNANAQWTVQSSGFSTSGFGINSISIVNSNVVWVTAYDTAYSTSVNEFSRTLNGGTLWTPGSIPAAANLDFTSIFAITPDTAWVSMSDNQNGGGAIFKTTNGGTSWTAQTTATFAAPNGATDFVYFFDKNNGVCVGDSNAGYWEIYTSVNGGTNWNRITAVDVPANLPGEAGNGNAYSVVGNTVWFGTDAGRVYKSTNSGATWTVSSTGLTNCTRVVFKNALNGIATDGNLLVSTTNGGLTWTPLVFTGNLYGTDLCFVPGTAGTYISTGWGSGNNGSSYSNNDGVTWVKIDSVGHDAVQFLNSSVGWSGGFNTNATVGGMFKWNGIFTTGINNELTYRNEDIKAYPNPVKDYLIIEVSHKKETKDLYVEIIDVTGKTVIKQSNFNEGRIILKETNLTSGIYFFRVRDSNQCFASGKIAVE